MESFRQFGFLMQIKASEYERNGKKKKKRNDSGRICRLTLSWKAPSTQIRIFLWRIYIYIFTWIGLPFGIPSTHETSESSHRNIRMILQQNGSVSWRRESARKGLNTTSGAQLASLPLVKPRTTPGQASCLICSRRRRHLSFPFYCALNQPTTFLKPVSGVV